MNPKNPIQPLVTDEHGVTRFKENRIVRELLDFATERGFGLNEIARGDYSRDDRQQFAQLIGYSLHGYGELRSYVDDDAFEAAQTMTFLPDEQEARAVALQSKVDRMRVALVKPMAELFGVHPDDLSQNLPVREAGGDV